MAMITAAVLQIDPASHTTSKVSVTVRTRYNAHELGRMKAGGLQFRLNCSIWGQDIFDVPPSLDDGLFVMGSVIYPDATPAPDESHTFNAVVKNSLLNEDAGTDEIYARVSLRNLSNLVTVNKRSNVVVRQF